jgi:hypothetical protein
VLRKSFGLKVVWPHKPPRTLILKWFQKLGLAASGVWALELGVLVRLGAMGSALVRFWGVCQVGPPARSVWCQSVDERPGPLFQMGSMP